ncbi:MAG: CapA family protein [Bacteroidetes bacterium]|nr:CapA family protein [Bacteroidota bacterium]
MFKLWVLLVTVYFSTLFHLTSPKDPSDWNNSHTSTHNLNDSTAYIKILSVGDLMCHKPQVDGAFVDSAQIYDFNPSFRLVREILSSGDIVIGNLETVTAGGRFSGYPLFNSPDEFLQAVKKSGFNVIVTSNNHSLDRGEVGLTRTAQLIDSLRLTRVGTYLSEVDRDSIRVIRVGDFRIAILAYTYGMNGFQLSQDKRYLVNQIDEEQIRLDLNKSKKAGIDACLVYFHFGNEYERSPNTWQRDIVEKTFSFGADIILASHPHVIQPIEYVELNEESELDTGLVAFSLGNFISNQRGRFKQAGAILEITLEKRISSGECRISAVAVHPTWVHIQKQKGKNSHTIIPLSNFNTDLFSKNEINLMMQANDDTRKQLSGKKIFSMRNKNQREEKSVKQ